MFIRQPVAAVALAAGLLASTAAGAADQCMAPREAEALLLTLAPTLVDQVAGTCATTLPANAYLRRASGALRAKFAGEGDAAWPLAREAMKKIVGDDARDLMDTELARPMMTSMVAPMIAKDIKPADCPNIDRMLSLLDPLPARNTAGLVVAILEMSGKGRKGGKTPMICPAAAATGVAR